MIITRVMYWRTWRVPKYVMYSHIFGASWPRKFSQIKEDSDAFLKSFGTSDSALRKLLAHAGFQRQAAWLCCIYDLCVSYQNYIIYRWNMHSKHTHSWNMLEYVGIHLSWAPAICVGLDFMIWSGDRIFQVCLVLRSTRSWNQTERTWVMTDVPMGHITQP